MTFLVFQALKRPKLNFLELSKAVFGVFVAQLATKLAGGEGALSTPPLPQEELENFRVIIGLNMSFKIPPQSQYKEM